MLASIGTHVFSNLYRVPSPSRQQYPIADRYRRRFHIPILVGCSGSNGDHTSFGKR